MRWAWIGLAIVSAIGYLWLNPLIVLVSDGEEGDRAGTGKDEVENAEEDEEVDEEEALVDAEAEDDGPTEA